MNSPHVRLNLTDCLFVVLNFIYEINLSEISPLVLKSEYAYSDIVPLTLKTVEQALQPDL